MYLLTTPLEKNFVDISKKNIQLGSWCNIYKDSKYKYNLIDEIIKYHYDDRDKLYKDWLTLLDLYEVYLEEFTNILNGIHKTKYNNRFWEMVIGYWLIRFIGIVFDRYQSLLNAYKFDNNLNLINITNLNIDLQPNLSKFSARFFVNDCWNYKIYSEINNLSKIINFRTENIQVGEDLLNKFKEDLTETNYKKFDNYKDKIKYLTGNLFNFITKKNTVFFYNAAPFSTQFQLYIKLFNFPAFFCMPNTPNFKSDNNLRQNIEFKLSKKNDFNYVLSKLLIKCIPKIYLEGFNNISNIVEKLHLPSKPKVILTCSSHFTEDAFKVWMAKKANNKMSKSKIFILQHGGGPFYRFTGNIDFELNISDKFFASGKGNEIRNNIQGIGRLNYTIKKNKYNKKGQGLLVTVAMPRYCIGIRSVPIANQMHQQFESNFQFISNLKENIRKEFIVRIYPKGDFEWKQSSRWRDKFKDINLDEGKLKMEEMVKKARLFVSTYNGTTWNESFIANVPTIMYWDPKYWERIQGTDYVSVDDIFDDLEKNKIYHKSSISAANFINTIWNNIDDWWYSSDVQNSVKKYCDNYSLPKNKGLGLLIKTIQKEI